VTTYVTPEWFNTERECARCSDTFKPSVRAQYLCQPCRSESSESRIKAVGIKTNTKEQ